MREVDNRNLDDMIVWYEARIEMLLNKIFELEEQLKDTFDYDITDDKTDFSS